MRKLVGIDISEISLVDMPANRTHFAVVKRKKSFEEKNHLAKIRQDDKNDNQEKIKEVNKMDELVRLYKSLYKDEIAKDMKPDMETFAEEDIKILKDALDIFTKYRDDLPDELADEIVKLAKFAVSKYPKEEKEEKKDDTEVEKKGAKLSKDSIDNLKKAIECLMSILPEEDKPEVKKVDDKEEEKVEKKEEPKEEEKDKVNEGFEKSLKELKESILGEISKGNKVVEGLAGRLEKIEEVKGVKKSLEEEKAEKDKKEVKKGNWPSLVPDDDE